MNLHLGNLTIEEASERMEIDAEKFKKFLDESGFIHMSRCDDIEKNENNYHIFDIPFQIHCGSEKTARAIYGYLEKQDIKGRVQFSY